MLQLGKPEILPTSSLIEPTLGWIEASLSFYTCMCIRERERERERERIPDLSQADTSYYEVHKIQLITKHHILLLGFAITT